jgi:hypothetical protein
VILEKLTMWSALCVQLWRGKEVILEPKSDMFEKHVGKTKVIWDMPHLGKNEKEYVNKKCTHAKNEVIYLSTKLDFHSWTSD